MEKGLIQDFNQVFGTEGEHKIYFAPGRVNLIGEHTDYNGGHVFPCALTLGTYAVARKREDRLLRLYSKNFEDKGMITLSLEQLEYRREASWSNYPMGVIWALQKNGYRIEQGMDILYFGNLPNSSGLSSSASIEVLTGFILRDLFRLNLNMIELALLCQYAENKFIGVNCGIMDQFAVAMGKRGQAIFLDTADLSYEYAPLLLGDAKIVIINTNKKRGLETSQYNERRRECETALTELKEVLQIDSLGELTNEQFEQYKDLIKNPIHRKRAKHAVAENQRTLRAVQALRNNDIEQFGKLMLQSHESLRDDYEVTGIELDTIVESAIRQKGVFGARMTGAGFGGCAVSIVKESCLDAFLQAVGNDYLQRIGYEASFYIVEAGEGPNVLT